MSSKIDVVIERMDPSFRFPTSPGNPLFPVSPERVNRQHLSQLPHSPSITSGFPENQQEPFLLHSKTLSDVQGKVAQFNNLNKEAVQRKKDHEAALRRAVLGREEAESEARRSKEESRTLKKELEEGRGKERRVGERLESVMEEMQRVKETHAHSQTLYEKEIRRARKEAFKSSSALVKSQEELKATRNRLTLMKEDVEVQKRRVENREQETFAAQYQLVGLQEEMENAKQQMRVLQEERDTLRTSLKEEEVARIAAEGRIALPVSKQDDEFSSPKKKRPDKVGQRIVENDPAPDVLDANDEDELNVLYEALRVEKAMRARAIDQIEFMKMECQFQCCSCRIAEKKGTRYVHDDSFAAVIVRKTKEIAEMLASSDHVSPTPRFDPTTKLQPTENPPDPEPLIEFSPISGTFHAIPSPRRSQGKTSARLSASDINSEGIISLPRTSINTSPPPTQLNVSTSPLILTLSESAIEPPSIPQATVAPSTPLQPLTGPRPQITRIISTTTTIPLHSVPATPSKPSSPVPSELPFTPRTMSREEALEQIRQRRGRARSVVVNGTPRKVDVEAQRRRDISAPSGRV